MQNYKLFNYIVTAVDALDWKNKSIEMKRTKLKSIMKSRGETFIKF